MTFQSRFGPKEWLKPYTLETVQSLPAQGAKNIVLIAPGFVADCLETLEELGVENRKAFRRRAGRISPYSLLNDSDAAIDVISDVVMREAAGWI